MENFFAGEILTELAKLLGKMARGAYLCRQTAQKLRHDVEQIGPIVMKIQYSGVELPQHLQSQLAELRGILEEGLEVARKAARSNRWNVYQSHKLAQQMERVYRRVRRWLEWIAPAHALYVGHCTRVEQAEGFERIERRIAESTVLWRPPADVMGAVVAGMGGLGLREEVMDVAAVRMGKEKVKKMLLGDKAGDVVAIRGIGGSGKTTLAKELCRDPETVSQSPDLGRLKQELWTEMSTVPSAAGPFGMLPQWPSQMVADAEVSGPVLVVLDDVWSELDLEDLILGVPGCKTLVVSRFKFQKLSQGSTYELELLGEEESLRLFCQCAFGQQSIPPSAHKELVMQVVAECKGLPLALKVIGASLRDQPPKIWMNAKNKLSLGEAISESHEAKLLKRMAVSIERLPRKVMECFLDLGFFPEDKKIPLDVLINMWMEVHDLTEEAAYAILLELSDKNLLDLVKDVRSRAGDEYSSYSDFSVSQHDVLRDVALYMSNCESANQRQRLIMAKKEKEGGLPKEWERGMDLPFDARIVSIHTGEMREFDWYEMHFPKAEALILTFSSGTYCLPPFIRNMPKLKVLILANNGSSSTVLNNLSVLTSLHNLRSLWFEKITVPPLPTTTTPLQKLKKISLVLCEFNESLEGFMADLTRTSPRLSDLIIDHCPDLVELPPSICEISTLQCLSISNCHDLYELPSELGKLTSLRILRVCACPSLEELPESISQLRGLEYLDISQCIGLQCLPDGLARLGSLRKIDMRECPMVVRMPRPAASLTSLKCVVCSEDAALMWRDAMRGGQEFEIQVAEEYYNMDWFE
ncbi:hypothetical protein Taro_042872 [Colocasia esculenta]|uniref:RPW8 domain-containing protein n=1 Tax=Colocasia esculenta TaxID=4460 RepID=A0A843WU10_COLES|nr:hypothetical protein [Colocasia esculenta]